MASDPPAGRKKSRKRRLTAGDGRGRLCAGAMAGLRARAHLAHEIPRRNIRPRGQVVTRRAQHEGARRVPEKPGRAGSRGRRRSGGRRDRRWCSGERGLPGRARGRAAARNAAAPGASPAGRPRAWSVGRARGAPGRSGRRPRPARRRPGLISAAASAGGGTIVRAPAPVSRSTEMPQDGSHRERHRPGYLARPPHTRVATRPHTGQPPPGYASAGPGGTPPGPPGSGGS